MKRVQVWGEIGPSFVYGASRTVNERTLVRLIDAIADAGADLVKVQLKGAGFYAGDDMARPPHDPERAPFKTRGEYVQHREPDRALLQIIDGECTARGISWTASPWDLESVRLLAEFQPEHVKIASACLTNHALLRAVREQGVHAERADRLAARVPAALRLQVVVVVLADGQPWQRHP